MQIEFVKPARRLGELNTSTFFCKCQMTNDGTDHICVRPPVSNPSERRHFYITAITLMLGLAVIAWGIVRVLGT